MTSFILLLSYSFWNLKSSSDVRIRKISYSTLCTQHGCFYCPHAKPYQLFTSVLIPRELQEIPHHDKTCATLGGDGNGNRNGNEGSSRNGNGDGSGNGD